MVELHSLRAHGYVRVAELEGDVHEQGGVALIACTHLDYPVLATWIGFVQPAYVR